MYRFFIDRGIASGQDIHIIGDDYNHIKNVLRMKRGEEILITKPESKIKAYIIPTNEELVIARDTKALVEGK